jgi:phosphinothricin acetyltransferase
MSGITIVDGRPEHLPGIAEIYAAAVKAGPATFDLEAPSPAWWRGVLDSTDPALGHILLAAQDEDERVMGYVKSGPFRPKAAYASTCETSIYVADRARGRGVGSALYTELLGRLDRSGLRLAVAGMTDPNPASARLHRAHGFEPVGTFAGVGVKFGTPWNVTWYQRPLRSAALLDEVRLELADAGRARAEAAQRVAALLQRSGGHRAVEIYALAPGEPELLASHGRELPGPLPDAGALAPGRPVLEAADAEHVRAAVPVMEPDRGHVLGALMIVGAPGRAFDRLDEGLLTRCAEALLPLWQQPEAVARIA